MKAAIISIGNELLNGQTADTNTAWLAQKLFEAGILVVGGWTVPDDTARIVRSLNEAVPQADVVLVTGGLGPTDDDVTRQAIADYLEVELLFRPEILDVIRGFFVKLGKEMVDKNRSQAYVPAGCDILPNPYGTAPGFWCQKKGGGIAVLPGVPEEMKQMYAEQVWPRIHKIHTGSTIVSGKVRVFGTGESTIAQRLGNLMDRRRNPLINCTCGSGEIILQIMAQASDRETAKEMVLQDKKKLAECLGDWIYGYDDEPMGAIVGRLLRETGRTIAVAESCTGGLIAKLLTDIPGSSDYVTAGWITYTNQVKTKLLDVPEGLIQEYGAVSEPVARAMAIGAARKAGVNISIAVTGIAGPGGGTRQKPVGLTFIGICMDGKCDVEEHRFPAANREGVRLRAALTALNMVRLKMRI